MKQYRKLIDEVLIEPQTPYNVITESGVIGLCFDFYNLTVDQENILKTDGWKEFMYNYEADNNEIVETDTQIIQNVKKIIPPTPNPEDIFNYDLCITELLNRFFYEFKIGCPVEALQIQSLVQSRLKPFKAIAQFNYFNKVQNLYPVEIVDGVDIFDTYNKLIELFSEQNIDLNKYLEEHLKA